MPLARALCSAALSLAVSAAGLEARAAIGPRAAFTKPRPHRVSDETWLGTTPIQPLTATAWITSNLDARYRLEQGQTLALLARFTHPGVERTPEWRSFWNGRYGPRASTWAAPLSWNARECQLGEAADTENSLPFAAALTENTWQAQAVTLALTPFENLRSTSEVSGLDVFPSWAFEPSATPEPELLPISSSRACASWQRERPVTVIRYGSESDVFRLLECDGSVAPEALDRLSVLARPPGSPKPELPLPLEPQGPSEFGEWLPELKMVHPRLVWALSSIARAFPRRAIYLVSGYRRDGHGSFHRKGRALDLFVTGIPNEDLFAYCRTLNDVGCGYYPHSTFIHIDVRHFGTGHPMWIDIAEPGKPSEYVDSWPGVAEAGALEDASEAE